MSKSKPITPQIAAHINDEKEENALHEYISEFNQELNAKYLSGGSVRIRRPGGFTDRIERKLLDMFKESGWNIKKKYESGCSDPRESTEGFNYYVFKASAALHGEVSDES